MADYQTTKDRLLVFLREERLSQGKFERTCGLSNGYVNNLKRSISSEKLELIAHAYPALNIQWLMTGEGEMLTESEPTIISPDNGEHNGLIPFYDAETTGGNTGYVSSSMEDVNLVGYIKPGGWFGGKITAAIRHVGESMTEYPDGSILAVREVLERKLLVPGRNYVIETSEFRVTKRVQKGATPNTITLYSTNQERYADGRLIHEPFEVAFEDIRRIYSVIGYIVNQAGDCQIIQIR